MKPRLGSIAVVAVVAVLTALTALAVVGHLETAPASSHQDADPNRARLIQEVNSAGDATIARLTTQETACESQVDVLKMVSQVAPDATATALDLAKAQLRAGLRPFVAEVSDAQSEVASRGDLNPQSEEAYLSRIKAAEGAALGEPGVPGAMTTLCQTVLVEVQQTLRGTTLLDNDRGD